MGVGDALHAAQHGVEEDHRHAHQQAPADFEIQKAGEDDADATHLAGDVGERNDDQADDRHHPRRVRVVAFADELRHGELAEAAEVRCQQQGQHHVAAGPAHQIDGAVVAQKSDHAGQRNERRRRHPVRRRRHAIGHRMYVLASDVELAGAARLGEDGDADVERERQPDDQIGEQRQAHDCVSSGVTDPPLSPLAPPASSSSPTPWRLSIRAIASA